MNDRIRVKHFATRKGRRLALKTQRDAAIAAGYDPDHFIDLDEVDMDELLSGAGLLRRGCVFGIYRYEFMARAGSGQTRDLKSITDRLLKLGVVVEELETGKSCKDENGVYEIYSGAVLRLSGVRRHKAPGRPVEHVYSDADCQLIQAAWHGAEDKNPKGRTASVLSLLGEDGKPRFPKFKQSTWYSLRNAGRVK